MTTNHDVNQAVRVLVYEWVWAVTPNRCLLIGRRVLLGGTLALAESIPC